MFRVETRKLLVAAALEAVLLYLDTMDTIPSFFFFWKAFYLVSIVYSYLNNRWVAGEMISALLSTLEPGRGRV